MNPIPITLVLFGCVAVLGAHVGVLNASGLSAQQSVIAQLSRTSLGNVHALGIVLFAVSNIAMARLIDSDNRSRLIRTCQTLLVASGLLLVLLAYQFSLPESQTYLITMWILASVIGICMGCLIPGLRRVNPIAGSLNLFFFILWVLMIPVGLWCPETHTGTYERAVGLLYIAWVMSTSLFIQKSRTPLV